MSQGNLINSELLKLASHKLRQAQDTHKRSLLKNVARKQLQSIHEKRAFVSSQDPAMAGVQPGMENMPPGGDPSMGGMPPGGDPAAMGGMPPGGGMDPAMMGGMPPGGGMDPAMMGGDPSMGGMPPGGDPAMMGGAPPMEADPMAMIQPMIDQAVQSAMASQAPAAGAESGSGGKKGGGAKAIDNVLSELSMLKMMVAKVLDVAGIPVTATEMMSPGGEEQGMGEGAAVGAGGPPLADPSMGAMGSMGPAGSMGGTSPMEGVPPMDSMKAAYDVHYPGGTYASQSEGDSLYGSRGVNGSSQAQTQAKTASQRFSELGDRNSALREMARKYAG